MKYLVIGSGAMGFYAMLGHLKTIEHRLSDVQEISGASAGSILAVMLALGKSIDELIDISLKLNISDLVKVNLKCFLYRYGFIDVEAIRDTLVKLCKCDPTFSELKKKIYITAFCMNTARTEYFSVDTHPDMKVFDAVSMSIAIPFAFSPVRFNGNTYVDGGTVESIPLIPFLDKKPHDVYCIEIKSRLKYTENIDDMQTFVQTIVRSTFQNRYEYDTSKYELKTVDVGDMDILDFNMSYEDKIRMYMKGTS
tara:strand:+ start:65 stop:820 length:756 start_codon:yes stop_codon:yes gene_type:complete